MRKVLMLIFMLFLSLPSLCLAQNTNFNHTIPEPTTLLLLGSGLAGVGALEMWRRIKSKR